MEGFPRRGWEPAEDFNILGNIFVTWEAACKWTDW